MIPTSFEPIAAIAAHGQVHYVPRLADPSCGFGALEVHPNKVPVERDGRVELEYNGEYLVVWGPSIRERFACCGIDEKTTALECAELLAAINNENKPTRVVDACGSVYTSRFSEAMLKERATQRGIQVTMMGDLIKELKAQGKQ